MDRLVFLDHFLCCSFFFRGEVSLKLIISGLRGTTVLFVPSAESLCIFLGFRASSRALAAIMNIRSRMPTPSDDVLHRLSTSESHLEDKYAHSL